MISSDILVFSGRPSFDRIYASCTGSTCTYTSDRFDINQTLNLSNWAVDEYQAIAVQNGIRLAQGRSAAEDGSEFSVGYGGWLDSSAFAIQRSTDARDAEDATVALALATSIGAAAGTNPVSGTATWAGVMVGWDVGSGPTRGNAINGHAGITVDFANADVDVAFTNIFDLETVLTRSSPIEWTDIDIKRGVFHDAPGSIQGRFYGTNHEEVGGVFERDDIVGAFGARRD